MNNTDQLTELYEQLVIAEATKGDLTNVKNDVVGNLKKEDDLFGEKPDLVDVPAKAKIKEGPTYKISTSSETAPQATSSKHIFDGAKPAKSEEGEDSIELKGTRVTPKTEDDENEENEKSHEDSDLTSQNKPKKDKYNYNYKKQEEQFTMNSFENLFKKTLLEQDLEDTNTTAVSDEADMEEANSEESSEMPEMEHEEHEEEEGDLISDLRELQVKLSSILDRLEGAEEEEQESEDESNEDQYSDEDFESEFGEDQEGEEESVIKKESVDKPKPLANKNKKLQGKDNKVGKVRPKGGKAHSGNFKNEPQLKSFSSTINKGKGEVKSSITKGDFIK